MLGTLTLNLLSLQYKRLRIATFFFFLSPCEQGSLKRMYTVTKEQSHLDTYDDVNDPISISIPSLLILKPIKWSTSRTCEPIAQYLHQCHVESNFFIQ